MPPSKGCFYLFAAGPGSAPASGSESPPARREGLPPRREGLMARREDNFPCGIRIIFDSITYYLLHYWWSRKKSASPFDRLRVNGVTYWYSVRAELVEAWTTYGIWLFTSSSLLGVLSFQRRCKTSSIGSLLDWSRWRHWFDSHPFLGKGLVHPVRNSSPAIAGLKTERRIISNGVNLSAEFNATTGFTV